MENKFNDVYYGKGNADMYDEYMDFINYVFGFDRSTCDFKTLIPKLYRAEDNPAAKSYVVVENKKLKAAVGAYDLDICVAGNILHSRNIGNVAVHPYARGKGYMRRLMNDAIGDMIKDGIDFSVLCGQRQRYNYFSYEPTGVNIVLEFNSDNIRHKFGKKIDSSIKLRCVTADDDKSLDGIAHIQQMFPFYAFRDRNRLFDILSSWKARVFSAWKGDVFEGYAVVDDNCVTEIAVRDEACLEGFVAALFSSVSCKTMLMKLPCFMSDYIDRLYKLAEEYTVRTTKSFTVLNYENTVRAFMELKAQTSAVDLPDGDFTLLIHGRAGDETIKLMVEKGVVSVEKINDKADLELEHIDAINLLFSPICPKRDTLPTFVRLWLPLPINIYDADMV